LETTNNPWCAAGRKQPVRELAVKGGRNCQLWFQSEAQLWPKLICEAMLQTSIVVMPDLHAQNFLPPEGASCPALLIDSRWPY